MIDPAVSIITPTHNRALLLKETIESVLKQTYPHWEMIIVNDGSTDNTITVVQEYTSKYPNIRFFSQENKGPFRLHETYNFALQQARGKYIAVLEDDDFWKPDKLEKQIPYMEEHPSTVLSWGRAEYIDGTTKDFLEIVPKSDYDEGHYNNLPTGKILHTIYFTYPIPALTMVFRKDALIKIGGFHGKDLPLVDFTTVLALSLEGPFRYVPEVLASYRVYSNQVSKANLTSVNRGLYTIVLDHYKHHKDHPVVSEIKFSDLKNAWENRLLIVYSRSGRYKLLRKDFKGARADYMRSIFYPGLRQPLWRIRSLIGFTFSIFNLNIEWFAKLAGRKYYRS